MARRFVLVLAAVAVAAATSTVRAGMLDATQTVEFPASGSNPGDTTLTCTTATVTENNTYHSYDWALAGGNSYAQLSDNTTFVGSDSHIYTQSVDGDPIAFMTEWLYNNSGVDWYSYDLSITSETPGVTAVFGSASSTPVLPNPASTPKLADSAVVTSSTIHFSGVSSNTPLLGNGDMTTLTYSIIITPPNQFTGPVTYCITAVPTVVPEPASIAVLAAGAAFLLSRKRR